MRYSCGQQDGTTYIGALEIAIKSIRRYAPDSLLVMATPLYRREMPDDVHPEKEGCDIIARIFAEQVEYFMRYRLPLKEA